MYTYVTAIYTLNILLYKDLCFFFLLKLEDKQLEEGYQREVMDHTDLED